MTPGKPPIPGPCLPPWPRLWAGALVAVLSLSSPLAGAHGQQARCAAGFVEVYFEGLRESRCMSEADLRTLSLRRQQQDQVTISRRQQQYLYSRQKLTQREQQRLTRP